MKINFDILNNIHNKCLTIKNAGIGETAIFLSSSDKKQIIFTQDNEQTDFLSDGMETICNIKKISWNNKYLSINKYESKYDTYSLIDSLYCLYKNSDSCLIIPDENKDNNNNNNNNRLHHSNSKPCNKIIISCEMITFPLPSPEKLFQNVFSLISNQEYNLDDIVKKLVKIGYKRVDRIEKIGDFSLKGDLLDIFVYGSEYSIRINFFDDLIENIFYYDNSILENVQKLKSVTILPVTLFVLDEDEKNHTLKNIANFLSTKKEDKYSKTNQLLLDLSSIIDYSSNNIDTYLLKLFSNEYNFSIYDYISDFDIVVYKKFLIDQQLDFVKKELNNKLDQLFFENFNYCYSINLQPSKILIDNIESNDAEIIDFQSDTLPNFKNNFSSLISTTRFLLADKRSVVFCLRDEESVLSLQKVLHEHSISTTTDYEQIEKSIVYLTPFSFPYNILFKNEKIQVFGSNNFAHKKKIVHSKKINSYYPQEGDYVVHTTHGIGFCKGIINLNIAGASKDYYHLIYRDNTSLYVPCENSDMLSYYGTGENLVRLNKIGGKEFSNLKNKASESVQEMAKQLITLYAQRKNHTRPPFNNDDYMQTEFEDSFPFEETEDQLLAMEDIARDMHSPYIMDRLVCGDVGYGKTEVAFRAIFRAIVSGKQVVFISPTTVLCYQHYMNAKKRFKDFGINIEMLNRFVNSKATKEILNDLKDGKINLLISTHRGMSSDVKFDNLGLLVLDEEQKFGVTAKEKIKEMKTDVDVLSLSATPIPRTLNMALLKIRDLSILSTPPAARKPIKTFVLKYDIELLKEVILREKLSGGQVLVCCNRIDSLYSLASKLRNILPDGINLEVAHGQMEKKQLEDAVKRLYQEKIDVFLSTTIIENGVDLINANVLFVIDSQILGLSQMYQLRGRVGRSDKQGFAYFTYPKANQLSLQASQRLEAIAEHTSLGSGMKLAMKDLNIRGAGELLGKKQSGHISNIGYDMYIKLLDIAIKELQGEKVNIRREVKLDISISANIPSDYIAVDIERLKAYNMISNIDGDESQKKVLDFLRKNYGALPIATVQLCKLALIKHYAEIEGIKHIVLNKHSAYFEYYEDAFDKEKLKNILINYPMFSIKDNISSIIRIEDKEKNIVNMQNLIYNYLKS